MGAGLTEAYTPPASAHQNQNRQNTSCFKTETYYQTLRRTLTEILRDPQIISNTLHKNAFITPFCNFCRTIPTCLMPQQSAPQFELITSILDRTLLLRDRHERTSHLHQCPVGLTVGHIIPPEGQIPGSSCGLQHGPRGVHPPSRRAITLALLLPALGIRKSWIEKEHFRLIIVVRGEW